MKFPSKQSIFREIILAIIAGGVSYGTVVLIKRQVAKKKAAGS